MDNQIAYLKNNKEDNEWLEVLLEEKKMDIKKDVTHIKYDLIKINKTIEYLETLLIEEDLSNDTFDKIYNQKCSLILVRRKHESRLEEMRHEKSA